MSDSYDPVSTQTTAISFRKLDALQDAVAIYGKLPDGTPVAVLLAADGTVQTRRLSRSSDEIVLIATDGQGVARPVLIDTLGRLSIRPLSALSIDHDSVRSFLLGPGDAQAQARADADGALTVADATARASLASILGQLDLPTTQLRDALAGAGASSKTLFALDQDLTASLQAVQPRSVANFPADYPDALAASRLTSILAQLDRAASEVWDVKSAQGAVTAAANVAGLSVTLDLGPTGRAHVQRFISAGAGAVVSVQVSRDAATWRTLETLTFPTSPGGVAALPGNGYRHVRVTSATAAVALEFEIAASR